MIASYCFYPLIEVLVDIYRPLPLQPPGARRTFGHAFEARPGHHQTCTKVYLAP